MDLMAVAVGINTLKIRNNITNIFYSWLTNLLYAIRKSWINGFSSDITLNNNQTINVSWLNFKSYENYKFKLVTAYVNFNFL